MLNHSYFSGNNRRLYWKILVRHHFNADIRYVFVIPFLLSFATLELSSLRRDKNKVKLLVLNGNWHATNKSMSMLCRLLCPPFFIQVTGFFGDGSRHYFPSECWVSLKSFLLSLSDNLNSSDIIMDYQYAL